jgi:acetyltransferase-like isoleucine patch superfamily enzyme/dTDP-4-dehydrorhamnose 3,5-epimerase-like enzyme
MSVNIHPSADVQSNTIGSGTRLWQYVVILPGAKIGKDVNICSHCFIENDVLIGDRVTIKSGVQLWDGLRIGDDAYIGPNATFTNDPFPRSKGYSDFSKRFGRTTIGNGATIGANATILPGLVIGENAMVGAGAVVTHNVPPNAIVMGNPARITGYVDAQKTNEKAVFTDQALCNRPLIAATQVKGVSVHHFPEVIDLRGSLTVGDFEQDIPFTPKRYFMVFDVPSRETRGEHAHRVCQEFMICVRGSCAVMVDDGQHRQEFLLDNPQLGIYLPPMVWRIHYKYTPDAISMVFASEHYDPADYIRHYDQFLAEVNLR